MSSKNKTILLIVVAAAVWGYAGVEWFSYFDGKDTSEGNTVEINNVSAINYLVESDKYEPIYDYEDPFIKNKAIKHVASNKLSSNHSKQEVFKSETPISNTNLAQVELLYFGTVSNQSQIVGLISLNNSSYAVKVGDIINGISIVELTNDHILIQKGSDQTKVPKQ